MKEPIQSGGEAMPGNEKASRATPILAMAQRLADAMSLYSKSETIASAAKDDGRFAGHAAKDFYDEELMVRSALSMAKAECLEDAAIQIAEALIHFDLLWDQFPKEAETFQIKQNQRAILRLLYSALDFIDGIAPQKIEALMGPHYANPHLSPWHHMEEVRRQEVSS